MSISILRKHALWVISSLIVCACTVPPEPLPADAEKSRQLAAEMTSWEIHGKIGFRNQSEARNGQFDWLQNQSSYDIRLRGPFGAGAVRIEGHAGYARLQSGSDSWEADTPDGLIQDVLQQPLPVAQLPYWIRGLPAQGMAPNHLQYDKAQKIVSFEQAGWQVSFENYQPFLHVSLPTRVTLVQNDYRATFIIQEWILPE